MIRKSVLLVYLAAAGVAIPPPSYGQSSPVLTVQDASWPPYYFAGSEVHKGFAKEVLERCLPAGGLPFQFVPFPIVRMFAYLRSGEIDVHVVSHDEEREQFLHFGHEPLFVESYRPIVRAGESVEISSLADLDDLRLGAIQGVDYIDSFQEYLQRREAQGTLEWAPDNSSILRMLLAGRIDIFVNTVATSRWLAESMNEGEAIRVLDFDVKTSPYFVVVSRASPRISDPGAYLDRVDACIRDLADQPELRALRERYHLPEPSLLATSP